MVCTDSPILKFGNFVLHDLFTYREKHQIWAVNEVQVCVEESYRNVLNA